MRPSRSFLLLLIFLICFTGLYYFLPRSFDLPTPETLIPGELLQTLFPDGRKNSTISVTSADTLQRILADTSTGVIHDSLSMHDTVPHPLVNLPAEPLGRFFDSLRYSKGQVRIMYYGDSQIEGDRLTSYLRSVLRKDNCGTGPGLFLPVMPVTYTRSIYVRASSNWKRFNYLSYKNGEISHNGLGPFMAYCRYMPENEISRETVKAWIRIVPSRFADSSASKYDQLRILYRNPQDIIKISVKAGNSPSVTDSLLRGNDLNEFVCPLNNAKNILIDFSGKASPDIYGISIESRDGIIVDNIPQRGSAGLEFTMVDRENLKDSYRFFSPDLIVLHYGLNIVRNVRNNYSYYEKGLVRQISLLKEISPGTDFVVVGLTDMAYSDGDEIKSYPNISDIIAAQRKASDESGALFWDAFKAMGGPSSIIKWNGLDPPLAKKDFVHFTDQGADTLARMMMSDLFGMNDSTAYHGYADTIPPDTISYPASYNNVEKQKVIKEKGFSGNLISLVFRYDPDKPFIFSAPAFWIFFLLVLAGFSLVYKRLFLRNLYLFLVSLFFYYKSGGLFLLLLLFVTLIDFSCGLLIHRSRTKFWRRSILVISIISNIGILAYFKYTGFFVQTINDILGTDFVARDFLGAFSNGLLGTHFDMTNIILPVGISFFTFQSLSYTIDMYRRKLEPVRNILDFGFYVSFFPQLVAGPIVRASEFIPQLYREYNVSQREFSHAVFLISKGLIKKIIISDFIAVNFIDRVFDLPTAFSGFENLMAVYGYGLQIYCDFSGYTDIAIGIALIIGFRLPFNFNSPYKAADISDFWKRWHISLSRWLKDYLYIPLGGNRKGKFRTVVNLMVTMLIGGLWHGADLRFIIWGGLHGIGLAIDKLRIYIFGVRTREQWFVRALSVFFTFQFVSFCWIFFRAPDMHGVTMILRQIFNNFMPASLNVLFPAYSGVFALMATGYLIHFLPEKFKEMYRGLFIKMPVPVQMLIVLLIGFMLFQMRSTEIMPFIYFRF
jgi:alginate O-acetyltransferase complex protein AlgI